ncbi:beta-1,3-galactosyltransferase 4 isoform X2 [Eupeodes corollae]|uniref:beta-1,3-galactosyltransferase 4 isoform X2 n=1 Tax=Eupeodes corollae TaxID=290404 RepID=UPI0024911A29|nr:beta-1,3-galactosyltransferase 4 isoform X2 [Eupeodes corollae]
MAGIQNARILRFLIAIGAVVLTIFVYASYYSNTSMGMSNHFRISPALVSSSSSMSEKYLIQNASDSNGVSLGNSLIIKNSNNIVDDDLKENRNSVIDIRMAHSNLNNLSDKLKYSHQDNANTNNQNNTSKGNKNNIVAAQKSIEGDSSFYNLNLQQQQQKNKQQTNHSTVQSSLAQPPSILIPANRLKPSGKGQAAIIDPTQGIPTADIYESGHLDVNPHICPDEGDGIKLLIIITSAHSHQDARLSIRQTWGHYGTRRDVAIAFILGYTNNQTLENALNQENYIYGDLIRGHFVDSYNNLTLKTISALEWVDQNCPQAKFVLKTDDDMFINVPKLMAFLEKHQKDKRVIFGRLAKKWKPIRNKKSKYYVSSVQFAATIFPPFTTGPAYVMSADVIHDLYMKALEQTYLKLEDVFTTGIVAQQLGIKRIHVNEFLNRRIAFNPCNIRKTISVHMIKSNEQFDLWKKLLDQSTTCK